MGDLGYRMNGEFGCFLDREFRARKDAPQMEHARFCWRGRRGRRPRRNTLGDVLGDLMFARWDRVGGPVCTARATEFSLPAAA